MENPFLFSYKSITFKSIERQKALKNAIKKAKQKFNFKAKKGIKMLIELGQI